MSRERLNELNLVLLDTEIRKRKLIDLFNKFVSNDNMYLSTNNSLKPRYARKASNGRAVYLHKEILQSVFEKFNRNRNNKLTKSLLQFVEFKNYNQIREFILNSSKYITIENFRSLNNDELMNLKLIFDLGIDEKDIPEYYPNVKALTSTPAGNSSSTKPSEL